MKLQLETAWYERVSGKPEHLHISAGRASIEPILEEIKLYRLSISDREYDAEILPAKKSTISSGINQS